MLSKKKIIAIVTFVALCFGIVMLASGRGDLMLYVVFTDSYNDEVVSEQQVEDGKDAIVPQDPYHQNYVFVGWYLFGEEDIEVTDFTNIRNDLKVEARYKGDLNNNGVADEVDEYYNISFIDGITNERLKSQIVLTGMNAEAPTPLTHEGYRFIGWNKAYSNVSTNLDVTSIYEETSVINQIIEPEAVITNYTLNFFDRYNNVFDTQIVKEGSAGGTINNVPVYTGLTLDGWYDQMNGLGQEYIVGNLVNKDMSIYGYWTKSKYEVIINANGGSLVNALTRNSIEHDTEFVLPNALKDYEITFNLDGGNLTNNTDNPMKASAELLGYCPNRTDCTLEELIKPNQIVNVTGPITYNAVWGDSINEIELPGATKKSIASTDYEFVGWSNRVDGDVVHTIPKSVIITGNTALYAVYTETTRQYEYKIITNKGNFEDTTFVNSKELDYGTVVTLPNLLRKYEIIYNIGENEILEASNTVYIDASLIGYCKNKETCEPGEILLPGSEITIDGKSEYYAMWGPSYEKLNIYTCAKANTESEKFTLDGWATSENGQVEYEVPGSAYIENDLNLYSVYTKSVRQYDITIDLNGGKLTGEVNYKNLDFGSNYVLPSATKNHKLTLNLNGGYLETGISEIYEKEATLLGYCYNSNTCTNIIEAGTEVSVGSQDKYVAQWGNAKESISLPSVTRSEDDVASYQFAGWSKKLNGAVTNTVPGSITLTADTTLYATYNMTMNQHTISFDAAGGSLPKGTESSIKYDHGVEAVLPVPTRKYTLTYDTDGGETLNSVLVDASFMGWCEDKTSCEEPIKEKATILKDTTYYAVWGPAKEPIKLASATKSPSEKVTYKFNYWRPKNSLPYKAGSNLTLKSDLTLKAYWTTSARKYTISFVSAFGTIPTSQVIAYDGLITPPETLVSEGKEFYGWYTSMDATKKWNFETDKVTGDTILYGIWDVTAYSINYNTSGGSLDNDNSGPHESGTEIVLPSASKGYKIKYVTNGGSLSSTSGNAPITLKGWCKNSASCEDANILSPGAKVSVDGNNIYYAIWETESNEVVLPNPTKASTERETFTFTNWTDASGNMYSAGSKIKLTSDLTLEAHYTSNERKYVVSFETEYGIKPNSQLVSYERAIDNPGILTDEMHTFLGWFKDSSKLIEWNFQTDVITSDTTVYASWSE